MAQLGVAYIAVKADRTKLQSGLNKAKKTVSAAVGRMQKVVDTLTFGHVGITAAAFSATFVAAMKKSIDAASDLEEVTSKFGVVFGDQVKTAEKWADTLVDSYAMSTREAKQYLSSVQDLLVPMGMQSAAAATLSNEIVKLSADLGSFNNLPTGQVMSDIQSALVGNFETMKKYGIVLTAARVQQHALNLGLADSKEALTAADKAQAAYALMVQGSTAAIGDMARTSGSYANQTKKLHSNVEDLSVMLGEQLLPVATDIVSEMNRWIKANEEFIRQDIEGAINGIATGMQRVSAVYNSMPDGVIGSAGIGVIAAYFGKSSTIGAVAGSLYYLKDSFDALYESATKIAGVDADKGMFQLMKEGFFGGGSTYTGKIGPETEGWAGYKAGDMPTMPMVTVSAEVGSDVPGGGLSGGDEAARAEYLLNLYTEQSNAQIELEKEKQDQLLELKMAGIVAEDEARIEALTRYIEYSNAEIKAEKEKEEAKRKIQKYVTNDMLKNYSYFFAEFGKQSGTMFEIWKGIEIAEAVANTAKNAVVAWGMGMEAGGPYAGPYVAAAYAASAVAFGAAQIAAISSASPGSSGTSVGTTSISANPVSNSDASTGISLDSYTEVEERGKLEINIQGDVIGDEAYIDNLVEKINSAKDDRDVTINYV